MTNGATLTHDNNGIIINVPLIIKRQEGRKKVIIPGANAAGYHPNSTHQEALVIAIARAHRWKKLLDEGKFESISDLAREIGLDVSFAARLLRLTLLAPDIIEAILAGEEPSGLSLTMLTRNLSFGWNEQHAILGFTFSVCARTTP